MADRRELGAEWLRDRADALRGAADRTERAYSPISEFGRVCSKVAAAYRKAAVVLDDAATELEDVDG